MFAQDSTVLWNFAVDEYALLSSMAIIVIVCFLVQSFQRWRETENRLPPGPSGLPFLGILRSIKGPQHIHYSELAKKYGPIFSCRLGSQLIVVISDYKMIRELFRKEEFTDRPITEFTSILDGYGVINIDGTLWKDQRRFLHAGLREFGMSCLSSKKIRMENRIMTEVEDCMRFMKTQNGMPMDTGEVFAVSVSNVICGVLMSLRFTRGDEQFRLFMHMIAQGFILFGSLEASLFIPAFRYWPGQAETRQKLAENRARMGKFFQVRIDEHRKSFDPSNMRDLVDFYLNEIQKAKEDGTEDELFDGKDHDRQMQQIVCDLFSAGMETIKSSLQWAIVLMLHYPDNMKAVQEELYQVVGSKRLPKLEDMSYLPVTESTLYEILRISSIVAMGTAHAPTRDVKLGDYIIPKHAHIVPLLYSVHRNSDHWKEPEKFNPQRFINSDGNVTKPDFFLPFGVGRRMCLGEIMAKMELFLFFSSLLHCFDISLPEGQKLPSLEGKPGITITPEPFKVCLKPKPVTWDSEDANHGTNLGSGSAPE